MKLHFLLIWTFLLYIPHLHAQDCNMPPHWSIVKDTMPGFPKQHDLFFASEKVGYTTGVNGTLRKTIDGGLTWEIVHGLSGMGTIAIMSTLFFVDELVGFASGHGAYSGLQNIDEDAAILRTIDGGLTWEKTIIDSIERVNDLHFFNAQHGLALMYANDHSNLIGQTFDGGKTWSYVETEVKEPLGGDFILAGDRVLLYAEDPTSWTDYILFEIQADGTLDFSLTTPPSRASFYFYNESVGYASTSDASFKTTDGGKTWTETNFPDAFSSWSILHFADENNGIIVNTLYEEISSGFELLWYPTGIEIFATENGGEHWVRFESSELCALVGRLSHYAKKGELHFHGGNNQGTYKYDPRNKEEENYEAISIFPNPVADIIHLKNLPLESFQAAIFNAVGQRLYSGYNETIIPVDALPAGYYVLRLELEKQSLAIPFTKQ